MKTNVGILKTYSVKPVSISDITTTDAKNAGYNTKHELLSLLDQQKNGTIYKIRIGYYSEDPRIALREQTNLSSEEIDDITNKLKRLDNDSRSGVWTHDIMNVISENPHTKAVKLAELKNRDKEWLKRNIRKLKNLGLTISHTKGYTLSPRGEKLLETFRK
ncbi:MAG: hypothetical protein LAT80_13825 [Balneolaceae bacterium]|nr:hypothetical protein [Balneolaceae bacterium]